MSNLMRYRALEASAEENAARMKRKRCEGQSEMCSPAEWIRQDDWPVGIRNVGNTCWFSAVIQVRMNRDKRESVCDRLHPSAEDLDSWEAFLL